MLQVGISHLALLKQGCVLGMTIFPFFPPIIHAFKTGIDSFLPPEILSDEEMSLITQEECPVWYWQTPTRFETEFSLRILVICDPGVSRSRLCVLALIPGFAQIGALL